MSESILWIAGHLIREIDGDPVWDILGVFDTEDKAANACYDSRCFVGPITLNDNIGQPVVSWAGAYYPKKDVAEAIGCRESLLGLM